MFNSNPVVVVKPKDNKQNSAERKNYIWDKINPANLPICNVWDAFNGGIIIKCNDVDGFKKLFKNLFDKQGTAYSVNTQPNEKVP